MVGFLDIGTVTNETSPSVLTNELLRVFATVRCDDSLRRFVALPLRRFVANNSRKMFFGANNWKMFSGASTPYLQKLQKVNYTNYTYYSLFSKNSDFP